ncbi:MAG: hypothetical protein CVU98_03570 [Firmicutes bacterium HGW-Firmicutes-3]|nr:MAG: hypothetical protein CVU98_03570 [Firmicutes bacterium HGW-Firmicutes-3]
MNSMNRRHIVKYFLLIIVFLFLSGCRPIEGLEPSEGLTESIDASVAEDDTQLDEPVTMPEAEETDLLHVQIIADVLNVRETASINSTIVDKVKENAVFQVMEEAMDAESQVWYKIKTEQEVLGWIFGAYCISVEDEDELDTTDE